MVCLDGRKKGIAAHSIHLHSTSFFSFPPSPSACATMYYHSGSQRHPSDATPWPDTQEDRLHNHRGVYESGGSVPPSVRSGLLDMPDNDLFGVEPARGGNTVYGGQGPVRQVRVYLLHQEHILKCTSYLVVPI
jgi:hypothetical protein